MTEEKEGQRSKRGSPQMFLEEDGPGGAVMQRVWVMCGRVCK